jgi:Tol biopolymer transport system component
VRAGASPGLPAGNFMRTRAGPHKTPSFTRAALFACALTLLAFVTFACGGGGGEETAQPQGTPFVTPAPGLPSVPPDAAEKAGLLVYRDTIAGQVFALDVVTGERIPVKGISPSAVANITTFDCTRDGRLIAYANSVANGGATVISFAGEGARSQSLELPGTVQGMAWAPDGKRMALTLYDQSGLHLSLLDVESGQVTRLPFGTGTPGLSRWSPDGQRLAYDMNENGKSDIFVLDVSASAPTKISTRPSAFTPDWSPDGGTVIFSAADDQGGQPQLFAVGADGTNQRQVTTTPMQKWSPRWSLDGSLISYAGLIIVPAVSARPVLLHNQAVWVAGADGTNETPVTDLSLDALPLAWCLRGSWL